jgi:GET complex subunit GET2
MMSTEESPAAQQARLRRERREKKILAQGSSRLEKIAGLQGGATAREALHPDPPEPDIAELSHSSSSDIRGSEITRDRVPAFSPGRNIFGVDGGDDDPFNMLRGGNDLFANMPEELKNDPMMKLLLNNPLFGGGAAGAGAGMGGISGNSSSDDLNRLAEKINQQFMGGLGGLGGLGAGNLPAGEEVIVAPDTSVWKWKSARIVSIFTVLAFLWTQLEDYHFSREMDITYGMVMPSILLTNTQPIFYTFIVFSLSLQALRLVLDHGRPLPGSKIATIGSFLPHPFGTVLIGFARYRMIFTDLVEDFATFMFGLGIMYWFKTW